MVNFMPTDPMLQQSVEDRSAFISKVYTTLAISLVLTAIGAYQGLTLPYSWYWPLIIANFVLMLACQFLHRSYPLNIILLGLFTWVMGLTLGPVLASYISIGAGEAIPFAAGSTAVVFGGLSAYAHFSKKDFSFLGGFLFMAIISMVVFSLVTMIFNIQFNQMIYSGLGVLVFSGYVLYDTSNLIRRYQSDQYVAATIALFLDIVNLFLFLLRLFAGGSNRR